MRPQDRRRPPCSAPSRRPRPRARCSHWRTCRSGEHRSACPRNCCHTWLRCKRPAHRRHRARRLRRLRRLHRARRSRPHDPAAHRRHPWWGARRLRRSAIGRNAGPIHSRRAASQLQAVQSAPIIECAFRNLSSRRLRSIRRVQIERSDASASGSRRDEHRAQRDRGRHRQSLRRRLPQWQRRSMCRPLSSTFHRGRRWRSKASSRRSDVRTRRDPRTRLRRLRRHRR